LEFFERDSCRPEFADDDAGGAVGEAGGILE
jgi:hypothetical protein